MVENTGSGADDIVGYAFLFGFPLLIVEPILMRIVVIVAVILGAASLIAGIVGLRNSKSTTSRVRNALGMALGVAGSLLSLYFQHEFFSIIQ